MILMNRVGLGSQFQFSLTHFLYFADQFYLIGPGDLRPLKDLINQLVPTLSRRCALHRSSLVTKAMNDLCEKQVHLRLVEQTTPVSRSSLSYLPPSPSQSNLSYSSAQSYSLQSTPPPAASVSAQTAMPAVPAVPAVPARPAVANKSTQAVLIHAGDVSLINAQRAVPGQPAASFENSSLFSQNAQHPLATTNVEPLASSQNKDGVKLQRGGACVV